MNSNTYTDAFHKTARMIRIGFLLALASMLIKVVAIPLFVVSSAISMIMTVKTNCDGDDHRSKLWLFWSATYSIAAFFSGVLQEGLFSS